MNYFYYTNWAIVAYLFGLSFLLNTENFRSAFLFKFLPFVLGVPLLILNLKHFGIV
jgi:hypothetical protein